MKLIYKIQKPLTLIWVISFIFAVYTSCVTTNYYTAKTLDSGEKAISAGADNLVLVRYNNEGQLSSVFGFTPSLGYIRGLPYRFESGAKISWPYAIEGIVRHQINKNSFKPFDISANVHYGAYYRIRNREIKIVIKFLKYGFTIGKDINEYQPFISYYRYIPSISLFTTNDALASVICVGVGLPFRGDYIIPEFNYLIINDTINDGILFFGIGVRGSFGNE